MSSVGGAMWYFAGVFIVQNMITSADFISNVIINCTGFYRKLQTLCVFLKLTTTIYYIDL